MSRDTTYESACSERSGAVHAVSGRLRGAFAAAAVALTLALAAGVAPQAAWANSSETMLGINMQVPSTAQQGSGAGTSGGSAGTGGVVGINLKVPDTLPAPPSAGENAGSGASSTGGTLGINLVVPSTAQSGGSAGTSGSTGTDGTLGINLVVPSTAQGGSEPDGGYDPESSAGGTLGINLVVPSTVEQQEGSEGGSGTQGTLGINLKVPKGTGVSFDPNHGEGQVLYIPVTPGEAVEEPSDADEPVWPNREFAGWYETQKDYVDDGDVPWDFSTPIEGNKTLYAGWKLVEPMQQGTVRLHLVVDDEFGPAILDSEAGACGVVPPGYVLDESDTEYGVTYVGNYYLGGGEEIDSTLALPEPEMAAGGLFDTWRTEYSPALDEDGEAIAGKVGTYGGDSTERLGRFDTGDASASHPEDGEHAHEFWAQWNFVETHTVTFVTGEGTPVDPIKVKDGDYARAPEDPVREGYEFGGWYRDEGLVSPFDFATERVVRDTVLYAKWNERPAPPTEHTVTFDAGKGAFEGAGSSTASAKVADGATVDMPDPAPKRPGWQFAGWHEAAAGGAPEGWDDGGASAVPLGGKWDFASPVTGDATLHAKWDLRLDVTVPVSVGFAVDAGSLEVTTPDEGRYALKSRTVRDVTVDEAAVASEEAELGGFFELADASAGWGPALQGTTLSLAPQGSSQRVALALAGDAPAEGGAWKSSRALAEAEKAAFTMEAFSYEESGASFDEGWRGADPSESLPLKLDMTLSEKLRVRTALDGPRPITHLKLTVSARA